MNNVVPIRPTAGMSRLDQLRAFVAWERELEPDKTHIAAWALLEIERLYAASAEAAIELLALAFELRVSSTVDGEWDGTEPDAQAEYDRLMALAERLVPNDKNQGRA